MKKIESKKIARLLLLFVSGFIVYIGASLIPGVSNEIGVELLIFGGLGFCLVYLILQVEGFAGQSIIDVVSAQTKLMLVFKIIVLFLAVVSNIILVIGGFLLVFGFGIFNHHNFSLILSVTTNTYSLLYLLALVINLASLFAFSRRVAVGLQIINGIVINSGEKFWQWPLVKYVTQEIKKEIILQDFLIKNTRFKGDGVYDLLMKNVKIYVDTTDHDIVNPEKFSYDKFITECQNLVECIIRRIAGENTYAKVVLSPLGGAQTDEQGTSFDWKGEGDMVLAEI